MRILFIVICSVFLLSCGNDDNGEVDPEVVCPTIAFPGFEIRVTNATTGSPLSNVTITARDGSTFEEILSENSNEPGIYQGVFEREGVYVLIVELDGFQTIITDAITVERLNDECNTLDTQELSFSLSEL